MKSHTRQVAMDYVLSLIGNPADAVLSPEVVACAAKALQEAGAKAAEPVWLHRDIAADIPFTSNNPAEARHQAGLALAGQPFDINIIAAAGRRKRLIVADMDSTIITCECLDEIADLLGLKERVSAITERAMRGELAFEPALRERVTLLEGLDEARLEDVYRSRVKLMSGAQTLLATMRENGAHSILVSGGFTYFTQRVAAAAGFEAQRGNVLLGENGKLTGKVAEPILGREAKLAALLETAAQYDLTPGQALAVGDGANDLAMIQAAGLGVAYHAKPLVAAAAGAGINHGDLTALLYLQGYSAAEFVTPAQA